MTVMERDEIERVERELDAILKLVQPEAPMQDKTPGMDTDQETAEKQKIKGFKEMAREEWAFSGEQEEIGVQNMPNKAPGEEEIKNEEQPPSQEHAPEDAAKDSRKEKKEKQAGQKQAFRKAEKEKKSGLRNPARGGKPEGTVDLDGGPDWLQDDGPEAEWDLDDGMEWPRDGQPERDQGGWPEQQPQAEPRRRQETKAVWKPDAGQDWPSGRRKGGPIRSLRLLKPSDGLAAAFFVPVIVMIIIFAQRGIFPFGEESFLRTDMYHQYAPFFSEFQYKLTHGGSLLYSWDIGMGVNFSALYAYYLASPVNWLLMFCPKQFIIEFMTLVIVLKIGLSGLSFAWYLKKHFGTRDFGVGLFGIFYALSGYMAAYSWNIMWLDCILLFPLILLGLERLVKGKSGLLYCITLGLSILSNYYISIMICIFMCCCRRYTRFRQLLPGILISPRPFPPISPFLI